VDVAGQKTSIPLIKAIPDLDHLFIVVGPSLNQYLNQFGFVLDTDTTLYKVCYSFLK